ncbi:MAG: dihydrolipoamide acetyltransferase family protein [Candidatus Limnocylindrales bacterium]
MAHAILMPKPGQMTEECVLVAWHKREGDPVKRGDVLFEIETDKSVMDVEAFDDGVLLRRYVEEGETVPVNSICAYVGAAGETVPDAVPRPLMALTTVPVADPAPTPVMVEATARPAAPAAASAGAGERIRISPRASRLAADAGLDPRALTGTGPGGRITERDVQAALLAAPGASEPAGRPAAADTTPPPGPSAQGEPRPLSRMRRTIAERLTRSWTTTPHFTVTVAVDMAGIMALRKELQARGDRLTVTDCVLSATAQTLAEFPDVNAVTDGVTVWRRSRVHLGLAVAVPGGLVVPVIRDADRLSLTELRDRAAALAQAARDGSLAVDDMTGSTFTVSNLGMFEVDEFSAIINPGEAAILAVSSVVPTPVAIGDGLAVRPVMKLTLSADHRLVDGETGARFLNALRRRLEDAEGFRNQALEM